MKISICSDTSVIKHHFIDDLKLQMLILGPDIEASSVR